MARLFLDDIILDTGTRLRVPLDVAAAPGPGDVYLKSGTLYYRDATGVLGTERKVLTAPNVYRTGAYFFPNLTNLGAGSAVPQNRIGLYPFRVLSRVQVSGFAVYVTTALAGGQFQLAIYGAGANNLPGGDPLVTTGSMTLAAIGRVTASITPIWLETNQIYYRGVNVTGGSTAVFVSPPLNFPEATNLVGILSPFSAATVSNLEFQFTSTFGTWPNVTGQSFTEAGNPTLAMALLVAALG